MSHPFFHDVPWRELYMRNFAALPEAMWPPKSKYDMAYHQERYKESRYDADDISRIWEQKNSREFPEDEQGEPDDLHVKAWSFVHQSKIDALEKWLTEQKAIKELDVAQDHIEIEKD